MTTTESSSLPNGGNNNGEIQSSINNNNRKRRTNIPSLTAAIMASMTTGGTTYAFGLYESDLQRSLHLSPGQVDTISTAFFFAGLFSWIPGLCADKFGTRFSLALGGVCGATACTTYWLVARQLLVPLPHSWLVFTLSCLGVAIFSSNALVTGSVFKIIVSACGAGTKGSAVGAAKGYVGLGSGAYACIFVAIRTSQESNLDFLPMAAILALSFATVPALALLPTRQQVESDIIQDEATPLHFKVLFSSLIVMAILVMGNSIAELNKNNEEKDATAYEGRHYGMAFLLIAVWIGPIVSLLYLPRRRERSVGVVTALDDDIEELTTTQQQQHERIPTEEPSMLEENHNNNHNGGALSSSCCKEDESINGEISLHKVVHDASPNKTTVTTTEQEENKADDEPEDVHLLHPPTADGHQMIQVNELESEENLSLWQMLQTPSALLMLWTTTILVGAGTVETNNMGQMVEALGFSKSVTPASLALFSVAQAAARVATGAISEVALNWNTRRFGIDNGVPRPFFLVVASLVGVVAHFMLGLATSEFFFVAGAALSGAAFGMVWPLMVLIVGEVFGTANAGANYMFYDGFTSAVGTLLLTKILAQTVYEEHIDDNATDRDTCIGSDCFKMTHMIVALLSITCVGTSTIMLYTSRHIYNKSSLHTP